MKSTINIPTPLDLDQHESLLKFENRDLGYTCYIALTGNEFDSAIGGCRLYHYNSDVEAANDAVKLSRGMAKKASVHRLPHNGGKAVLYIHHENISKPAVFNAFAKHVNTLSGKYVTSIDVGTTSGDMDIIKKNTNYVIGSTDQPETAEHTALGVYLAIKASCEHYLSKSLKNVRIGIQGTGSIGSLLINKLKQHTSDIVFTDTCLEKRNSILSTYPDLTFVEPHEIYSQKVDIFIPCALGGVINSKTLPALNTKIICGAANNQLASKTMDAFLAEKGIVYVPDYLASGGGLIYASCMYRNIETSEATRHVESIYNRCLQLMRDASLNGNTLLTHLELHHA